ncbi:alanine--tRNA ligase [uncultured Mailhella sp.]|uniref:alanine--tRNA ligase n=1 Tax=uncultured Mailhella sp. TaxID=1981031 RepID=UPI0025DBC7AA|nr:alanine--tRNA ligase [uncultured Mailhella sp.]
MLTAKEIRRKFLDFFAKNGHAIVPSSSLVPKDDPTLLFTNAGMVQFKKLYLGQERRSYRCAATSQKCLRVSGKHNDLENVGRTARHHTFFEMLGNFSFAYYFKREAITFAWKFVTEELHLPADKLYVTVYENDDEAYNLWQEIAGMPADHITRMGEKDNFWTMGDTGPCGPCSEIYIDQGEDMSCGPNCGIGKCDCDRFLEIWNLVFTQYDQKEPGVRVPLEHPNIDTGMGLERIAAVCQGKRSNFDCDLFQDIIQYAASIAGVKYSFSAPDTNDVDTALRVIADHSRAAAFMIADGILPSNEGRGYVLRRLIRRALRFGTLMGLHEAFLYKTVGKVVEVMGDDYPELREHADFISRVVFEEENRFRVTLDKGLALLDSELEALSAAGKTVIPGDVAFRLNDTYGFPLDIVSDVAYKRGFTVDEEGFAEKMQEQRARARAAWKGSGEKDLAARFRGLLEEGMQSEFVGYDTLKTNSRIVALLDEDALPVEKLETGAKGYVVTGHTPFYGASGGQSGDTGVLTTEEGKARVTDTLKPMPTLTVEQIEVTEGVIRAEQEVDMEVTEGDRIAAARNHSCTHLLQAALRKVLGSHVHQAGSSVGPDHLRFDFTHIAAMTDEEIAAVEREVNAMIMADYPVTTREMDHDEAVKSGAMALFNEKYGDKVRVVSMGAEGVEPCSMELCGGTHLSRTGQAGCFVILSEGGVAAGVRRIEAATGWNAYNIMNERRSELNALGALLKVRSSDLASRVEAMQKEIKTLRKELDKAQAASRGDVMSAVEEIAGVKVLAVKAGAMNVKALREMMDDVRSKMPSGVACLVSEDNGKAQMILYVSKDLHDRFTAPALIRDVAAAIGGSGGGRPDQAQAGGSNPEGIDEAFKILKQKIAG